MWSNSLKNVKTEFGRKLVFNVKCSKQCLKKTNRIQNEILVYDNPIKLYRVECRRIGLK